MFVIVDDVEAYPEFLTWCKSSFVHERTDEVVQATLELQKGGVSNKFTTRNERKEFESIDISLVGGPFRHLKGGWSFTDLGDKGCKVALNLDFEFENRPYQFIDVESGEKIKLQPSEVKDYYVKNMHRFKKELELRCGQYQIEFVEADVNKGFDQILMPYLLKRSRMF